LFILDQLRINDLHNGFNRLNRGEIFTLKVFGGGDGGGKGPEGGKGELLPFFVIVSCPESEAFP
jgi:hypothetical protein